LAGSFDRHFISGTSRGRELLAGGVRTSSSGGAWRHQEFAKAPFSCMKEYYNGNGLTIVTIDPQVQ
jgi:hypothetical protein